MGRAILERERRLAGIIELDPDDPDVVAARADEPVVMAVVLKDYDPVYPTDIALREGELVRVAVKLRDPPEMASASVSAPKDGNGSAAPPHKLPPSSWWAGYVLKLGPHEEEGTFPSSYVRPVAIDSDISLRALLEVPCGTRLFLRFLEEEYADENLDYFVNVRAYRELAYDGDHRSGMRDSVAAASGTTSLALGKGVLGRGSRGSMGVRADSLVSSFSLSSSANSLAMAPVAVDSDTIAADGELCDMLRGRSKQIFDEFIVDDAPKQINIKQKNRSSIDAAVAAESARADIFDGAACEIFKLMEADSFARFQNSPLFIKFLNIHGVLCTDQVDKAV